MYTTRIVNQRLVPSRSEKKAESYPQSKYRPDIDGLRAIAVLSIVVYHAFPNWMKGGFIGVDIFFVISGYLISTIILKDLKKGAFSLIDFYFRRIRRIFPALILVLVASLAFGWYVLLSNEYKQLSKHVASGAGFVSNLIFWNESGYFDNAAETKPLLHLWSLGIEEQFYLVWPILLLFAWKKRLNILVMTIIFTLLSFGLNIKGIKVDSAGAYFSPQTRLWELLSGSLLAYFILHYKNKFSSFLARLDNRFRSMVYRYRSKFRIERVFSDILSFVGLLLLFYGYWRINKNSGYPGMWALVPVLSAILFISVGSKALVNRTILSNKIVVWFGLISYPLYLWHWPLLSFARIIEGEVPSSTISLSAIVLSIILAWFTYKFVESPIRFGRQGNIKTVFVFILMVTIGLVGYDSYKNNRASNGAAKVELLSRQIEWTIPAATQEQKNLCRKMFPERTQLTPRGRDDNFCFIKSSSLPNVLIIGDSMSFSLFPGLNKYDDINTLVLSASMAAPFYNTRTSSVNDASRFYNYKLTNQALDYAFNNENIKVVIMTFMHGPYLTDSKSQYEITNVENPTIKDSHRIFTESLISTLSKLRAKNKHVIYVLPNPILYYDITSCLNSYRPFRLTKGVEKLCAQSSSHYLKNGGREYREWVTSVLKKFPEVKVFDMANFLCDKKLCWGMKDERILYRDVSHLSIDGSDFIAPFLISQIREALGSDTSVVR